jgi:hypothetical protein
MTEKWRPFVQKAKTSKYIAEKPQKKAIIREAEGKAGLKSASRSRGPGVFLSVKKP